MQAILDFILFIAIAVFGWHILGILVTLAPLPSALIDLIFAGYIFLFIVIVINYLSNGYVWFWRRPRV